MQLTDPLESVTQSAREDTVYAIPDTVIVRVDW